MNTVKADSVQVMELIVCTNQRRGKGTEGDPVRIITQVFTKDGTLIAENDPITSSIKNDVLCFSKEDYGPNYGGISYMGVNVAGYDDVPAPMQRDVETKGAFLEPKGTCRHD